MTSGRGYGNSVCETLEDAERDWNFSKSASLIKGTRVQGQSNESGVGSYARVG